MRELEINTNGRGLRIGIVLSRFNSEIGEGLLSACKNGLIKLGVAEADVTVATVPGALETPLVLRHMAISRKYDALIALGAIIRGETYHFEVVSNESARALQEIAVLEGAAIGNGILTVENGDQAWARARVNEKNKGGEAAVAALTMVALKNRFVGAV